MKIALITDAWAPQINGVVTTLVELVAHLRERGHRVEVIHPGLFDTRPCPGYAGIDLAVRPQRVLTERLDAFVPEAIHIATEGPLGWAARRYCLRARLPFTTAYHTRFPEILKAALRLPLWLGYALFRHFHRPSAGVMVPTQGVMRLLDRRGFKNLRTWTHGVDTQLFTFAPQARVHALLRDLPRPIALYVGRVSYEKNIAAFLDMPWQGSKVVCGVGPLEAELKARNNNVCWLGVLPRDVLAGVYAAADVFTFPSRHETFGLVMLEAMACGTPVAAYPVDGPLEVLRPAPTYPFERLGGVLHEDLAQASLAALSVPRAQARSQALVFSWQEAALLFEKNLAPTPSRIGFCAQALSDPVFENYLRQVGRWRDYRLLRDEVLPSLLHPHSAQSEVVFAMSNHFANQEPCLRVVWGHAQAPQSLDIGLPPQHQRFIVFHDDQSISIQGMDVLSEHLQRLLRNTPAKTSG